jgi:hypothetical protein
MKKILSVVLYILCFNILAQDSKEQLKKVDDFGKTIASKIYDEDATYLEALFDFDTLFLKISGKAKDDELEDFEVGFKNGFIQSFKVSEAIILNNNNGGSYHFLKSYIDENQRIHILFRLLFDDGLNYHDYLVSKKNDSFVVYDLYIYTSGEYLSETLNVAFKKLISNSNPNEVNDAYYDGIMLLKEIRQLILKKEFDKAEKIFNTIPKDIRETKMFQLINTDLTSNQSDEKYLKALNEYETLFPNDPSLFLLSIDTYLLKENYDKALYYIDKLDHALKGDTYLDIYRAYMFIAKKDYNKAVEYLIKFNKEFPYDITGKEYLLDCYLELKNYDNVLEVLDDFIENFDFEENDLIEFIKESYPKFYKNKVFKDWQEQNKKD